MTYRLECFLDLSVKSTRLQSADSFVGIRLVGDRGSAFGAEDTVDSLA